MYENVKFDELFASKKAAVVCYLSLERKYLNLMKYHQQICRDLKVKPKAYNEIKRTTITTTDPNIIFFGEHIREAINTIKKWINST